MSGPQIWLCLFTFRPIASKQLNGLTRIYTLSWLGGAMLTHPLWVREVPGSIPGSGKGFMFDFLFFVVVYLLFFVSKTHYLSQKFAIPFTMLIYFVNLTYCKISDWLYWYKDTDITSLICPLSIVNLVQIGIIFWTGKHFFWIQQM